MNRDKIVAVPSLVFVEKAENVPQFMGNHPFLLPPPERRDVNLRSLPFLVSDQAGVIACGQIAGKVNIFCLVGVRNEVNLSSGVLPSLYGALDDSLLLW